MLMKGKTTESSNSTEDLKGSLKSEKKSKGLNALDQVLQKTARLVDTLETKWTANRPQNLHKDSQKESL